MRTGIPRSSLTLALCCTLFQLVAAHAVRAQVGCPNPPHVSATPNLPRDVCIPTGFGQLPIDFFDDYSWKAFLALVWPADHNHRGVPDRTKALGTAQPVVFETFKSEWELFGENGAATPGPWEALQSPNPCNVAGVTPGDLVLGTFTFSKFGNIGQAGVGNLVGPLVAQNRTYVRYSTGFNQMEYEQIVRERLYEKSRQSNVHFPSGAIDVKASWIEMQNVAQSGRYYTRSAWVWSPDSQKCERKLVGLVGLHIVQKTASRPQWIWSTFEQVDNVPPSAEPMAFNDAGTTRMPRDNPYRFPPPPQVPAPFNVQRITPIHPNTRITNATYQNAVRGTVWQFYQLVMTQWPVPTPPTAPAVNPAIPGTPDHTFPGFGATTAFANTTMETFDQGKVIHGCMNCHTQTQDDTDFVWALAVNAITTAPANGVLKARIRALPPSDPVARLKRLLQAK